MPDVQTQCTCGSFCVSFIARNDDGISHLHIGLGLFVFEYKNIILNCTYLNSEVFICVILFFAFCFGGSCKFLAILYTIATVCYCHCIPI